MCLTTFVFGSHMFCLFSVSQFVRNVFVSAGFGHGAAAPCSLTALSGFNLMVSGSAFWPLAALALEKQRISAFGLRVAAVRQGPYRTWAEFRSLQTSAPGGSDAFP